MNAQEAIDKIMGDQHGMTTRAILDALEDGEALAALGFTDADQEAEEYAVEILGEQE